ncbi:unnamed protein product [Rotaria sp. Silwood1]|nr:unnamed protein product [Rotaria sp. Silwood1]CAF3700370.1 unnamed protein product [Rotaria sp. Silwood1]CAF3704645.1 unnamed protein product [Rotaria sp. Silwood1]CAF4711886.1 unnamed protein product [Rotaria sp. Silwood1]CAF4936870.1 unnamed protein product [Rotaria sp. Silwood1]
MTTKIIIDSPSDDDDEPRFQMEHHHLLRPPSLNIVPKTLKTFPQSIIHSIETDRQQRFSQTRSASGFLHVKQSSIDTTDDDLDDNYETTTTTTTTTDSSRKRSLIVTHDHRSPSEIRLSLYPNEIEQNLINKKNQLINSTYENERHSSDPSFLEIKSSKQKRVEYLRRTLLEHRFSRRMHSSFPSTTTLRSFNRRRSTQTLSQRSSRRPSHYLSRNSKWHFVRNHLHDIAMMSESYARMKIIERDLRWIHLREIICKHILDMREMSILRQQDDGTLNKTTKTSFNLKTIPNNEVVHVEQDGRIYSMGIRDLVLGRFIGDDDLQLDTIAQLVARRKFQVKQNILKQQEGRTRLKKNIAFSFCLCNLSFIALMFAAMFIFAMTTIVELRSREFF